MLASFQRKLLAAIIGLAAIFVGVGVAPARADSVETVAPNDSLSKTVKLGLNKSLVVDLPRDARDVLISNPAIADAVMRTPRRIYLTGIAIGEASIMVFDRAGQQIVALDLEVERDNSALERTLARLIPGSNITVEVISDNIVLSGTVRNANDARRAQDLSLIHI